MSNDQNNNLARVIVRHAVDELGWMVDDDRAVSLLLTAAIDLLTESGLSREQAATRLHWHAAALHQLEVDQLRSDGLLMT